MKRGLIFYFLFFPVILCAQQYDDIMEKVNQQLHLYGKGDLFLHLDKSMYQAGDKIWFAAYVLDDAGAEDTSGVLHVVLIDDMAQSVITTEKYVLSNGVAAGSIYIADSLQTGTYSVIAYTSRFLMNPSGNRFFRQAVEVTGVKPSCKMEVAEVNIVGDDSLVIIARAVKSAGGLPKNAEIEYSIYGNGKEIAKGKSRINMYGEIKINLPFHHAVQILEMRGKIKEEKETSWFKIPLLWESKDYLIRLLPDAGQLVSGYPSRLFYQLQTTSGQGVSARLGLMEDNMLIHSFESDVYGIGMVTFTPHAGKRYRVVLKEEPERKIYQQFPSIQQTGYVISVPGGNVVTGDSITIILNTPENGRTYILTVHNNKEVVGQLAFKLTTGSGRLRLPVAEWPKGVSMISLFDDKAVLKAQIKILLPIDTSQVVHVKTDSSYYHTRSKISMRIQVTDKNGNPVQGMFSLSSTFGKAHKESFTDINRFYLLDRFLDDQYIYPPLSFLQDSNHLWFLLNHKNLQAKSPGLFADYTTTDFDGMVLYNEKKIKKPVRMIIMGPRVGTIETDKEGHFTLPVEMQQANVGEKIFISVGVDKPTGYKIILNKPEEKLNDLLAKQYYPLPVFLRRDQYSVEQREAIQASSVKTLQAVVVKSSITDEGGSFSSYTSSGGCNDYVCQYGILNCSNHPGQGTRAVEGQRYRTPSGGTVIYHCSEKEREKGEFISPVKPVYLIDTFSVADLTVENNLIAPEILTRTTLFWEPFILTDEKGVATVNIYTNNLKGRFTCILQGLTNDGVIHGKADFVVTE